MLSEMFPAGGGRWVVVLSALTTVFTVSHSIEDFLYGIPRERFHLPDLPAALVLALAYAIQVWGTALAARETRFGYFLNLALAVVWFLAATLDHTGEILFANPYRSGLVSKALELGIIILSAAWAFASARALAHARQATDSTQAERQRVTS